MQKKPINPINSRRLPTSRSPNQRPPQETSPDRLPRASVSQAPQVHRPRGAYPETPARNSDPQHSLQRPGGYEPEDGHWNGRAMPPRDSRERERSDASAAQTVMSDEKQSWPWYEKLIFGLLILILALVLGKHAWDVYHYGARNYFVERLGREDVHPDILREAQEKERDFDPAKVPGHTRTAGLRSGESEFDVESDPGFEDSNAASIPGQSREVLADFGNELIPSTLTSDSAVVWDVFDTKILYAKNADEVLDPASISKVMTSLLAFEAFGDDLDRVIVFQPEDFDGLLESGASMAGFVEGEEARIRDVIYGVLVPSGAEACNALAREVSGSVEAFVAKMNQRAEELGMQNSHFYTPSGLATADGKLSQSTVLDLLKLSLEALKEPDFQTIAGTHMWTTNPNAWHPEGLTFISTFTWKFNSDPDHVAEIIAGKSGFTGEAQNLMSYGQVGGREYVIVTLGARTTDGSAALAVHDHAVIYRDLRSYRAQIE